MKKLLLTALFLISCEIIQDPPPPLNCYCVELMVSSSSGKILNTLVSSDFVYESGIIEKWKADEGINLIRDSINHTITIRMVKCIEPDIKVLK